MPQQLNDKYDVLILPIDYNKSFLDFSGEEIQRHYQWFLNIKKERMNQLFNFLFTNCEDCLQEQNLMVIEIFLENSVSVIPKPKKQFESEAKKIPIHLKPYAKPDEYLLDERAISICYDIGIFMVDLIAKLDKRIKWELEIDDEFADFGQPVLAKKGNKLKLNPFRVAKNIAAIIWEKKYNEGELINVSNTWKKLYKTE